MKRVNSHADISSGARYLNFGLNNHLPCIHPLSMGAAKSHVLVRERTGSVVECLTQDQGPGFETHRHHCVVSLSKTH